MSRPFSTDLLTGNWNRGAKVNSAGGKMLAQKEKTEGHTDVVTKKIYLNGR